MKKHLVNHFNCEDCGISLTIQNLYLIDHTKDLHIGNQDKHVCKKHSRNYYTKTIKRPIRLVSSRKRPTQSSTRKPNLKLIS